MSEHSSSQRWVRRGLSLMLSFALGTFAAAEDADLQGQVVGVSSGAELTVRLDDGQILSVHLADVEAPVPSQPVYDRATLALTRLAMNRLVRLAPVSTQPGKYHVLLGDLDPAADLLTRGLIWVDRDTTNRNLFTLEAQARTAKRGLWHDPHPVPPQEWQAGHRPQPYREADISGLIVGDRKAGYYYPATCAKPDVASDQRLLFAREQDAKALGLRRRNCR
jgi:endonuclease YncB( thermonuclease family)